MKHTLKYAFLTLFLGVSANSYLQNPAGSPMKYAETITSGELKKYLYDIAGTEFEGRETGKKGQKLAADYLANHFKKLGIPPSVNGGYFQTFPLIEEMPGGVSISLSGEKFEFLKDFYCWPSHNNIHLRTNQLTFIGFGIEDEAHHYNDYKNMDVKDQVVMMLQDEPMNNDGDSYITGKKELSSWTKSFKKKIELAEKKGASAVLLVIKNIGNDLKYYEHYLKKSRTFLENEERKYGFPVLYISEEMANKALSKHKKGLTIESWKEKMRNTGTPDGIVLKTGVELNIQKDIKKITGENVLGYIEGTDLKDELVVITAHYDHLGISDGEIYYGADDDGSGTVSLMEIAEAFMVAKKEGKGPRRSVLIMPVSGEEKGLLGSDYYTQNPVFPLKNTVVDLNIDMIGRLDENHTGDPDYVYIIGSDKLSGELFELSEEVNKKYINIKYDYTYNDDSDPNRFYYRSDHYNFAKNNIPVIFYFTGVHEDYHKPTDTVDKIDYQKTERIARLVFLTAWEIANRTKRLEVDRIPK